MLRQIAKLRHKVHFGMILFLISSLVSYAANTSTQNDFFWVYYHILLMMTQYQVLQHVQVIS